jgi:hypothetical protein
MLLHSISNFHLSLRHVIMTSEVFLVDINAPIS